MSTTPSVGEKIGGEIGKAIGQEVGQEIGKEVEQKLTGTERPKKEKKPKSKAARRVGYVIGLFFALLFLWVVGNIETWNWRFITDEFGQVEGIIRAAIYADLVIYAVLLLYDGKLLYYLGKLVSDGLGIFMSIRVFQVFPFDFNQLFGGWGWLNSVFPWIIVLGAAAVAISFIVRTAKLASGKEIYD